jgi:hypothetical protein
MHLERANTEIVMIWHTPVGVHMGKKAAGL